MENFMNCLEVEGKHVKKPTVSDEELTYKEEDEDSQWNSPLKLSQWNSPERNQILNSEILDEKVDVSFAECHKHIFQDSSEEKFGRLLEELQLEQPCYGKQITENFAGYHDPVEKYMEKLCSRDGQLWIYSKDQIFPHNLLPLSPSSLVKHDEGAQSLDHFLDWLHWKP